MHDQDPNFGSSSAPPELGLERRDEFGAPHKLPEEGVPGPGSQVRASREHETGRASLRIVMEAELADPARSMPEPPDLRVDEATAQLMYRSRWHAVVRAHHFDGSGAALHPGFSKSLHESLDGRRPATGFAPEFVEVNFCVLDDKAQSWRDATAVGEYLTQVVDPVRRQPAELVIRFTDTSDIDPYLPEHLRTLS